MKYGQGRGSNVASLPGSPSSNEKRRRLLPGYRPCQLAILKIQLEQTSMMCLNKKFTQLLGFDSSPVTEKLIEFVHKHAEWRTQSAIAGHNRDTLMDSSFI